MTKSTNHPPKKEIEDLRKEIEAHDTSYYVLEKPEISDKEYDDLLKKLQALESQYPQYITPTSPTQRVSGRPVSKFESVEHRIPMLSLENTYSPEEVEAWETRVEKGLGKKAASFVLNPKIDGVSLSLVYEKGYLARAATRGDGVVGENVTDNARTIKSIPLRLKGKAPDWFEIRGEVFIDTNDFQKMNERLKENEEEPFVNPRNAASGSLRQKDARLTAQRPLKFFAHSYATTGKDDFENYSDFLKACQKLGVPVAKPYVKADSLKKILSTYNEWLRQRDDWTFEVDGIVVRVDNLKKQAQLGTTAKAPRWAIAYKYPAKQATTVLEDVEHSVGRTGTITPTAKLQPVECGGVVISNATLHNYDEVKRLGVKIGDTVLIERAGDVIPKVIKVVTSKRKGNEKRIVTPIKCPSCKTPVVKEEGEVAIRCPNPDCPVQIERNLLHFVSRDAMDIEGLGEAVVQQLIKEPGIRDVSDLYTLTKDDFLKLDLFADKRAENLVSSIEKSKKQSLDKMIFGLGVRNVGEKMAMVLADEYGSIQKLSDAKEEDLTAIPDVGPIAAKAIRDYFKQPRVKETLKKLKQYGVDPKVKKIEKITDSFLSGKTVVFTGELKEMTRPEAEGLVRQHGGKATGSVSKKTHYLVVGANPGSKLKKAQTLGVEVLSEEAFLTQIKKIS